MSGVFIMQMYRTVKSTDKGITEGGNIFLLPMDPIFISCIISYSLCLWYLVLSFKSSCELFKVVSNNTRTMALLMMKFAGHGQTDIGLSQRPGIVPLHGASSAVPNLLPQKSHIRWEIALIHQPFSTYLLSFCLSHFFFTEDKISLYISYMWQLIFFLDGKWDHFNNFLSYMHEYSQMPRVWTFFLSLFLPIFPVCLYLFYYGVP